MVLENFCKLCIVQNARLCPPIKNLHGCFKAKGFVLGVRAYKISYFKKGLDSKT